MVIDNQKTKSRSCRKRLYHTRLMQGLCPGCGCRRDIEGIQCSKCRAANNKSRANIPSELKNKYQNDYLKRNRKRGLCPRCGGRREDDCFVYCGKCREKRRQKYHINGGKARVILMGWGQTNQSKPKPTCQWCKLKHRQCENCGKWMSVVHGKKLCRWACKCGNRVEYKKSKGGEDEIRSNAA